MRSLSRDARFRRRIEVIELRRAGLSYVQIASQVGLSRTGVFDICKRHRAVGITALHDAPGGRGHGKGRTLAPEQEEQLRGQIIDHTPDQLAMPEALWTRAVVSRLIERRMGIVLPARTLALYLARWGFTARRPQVQASGAQSPARVQWLAVVARSKAQGGEINWGSHNRLLPQAVLQPLAEAIASKASSARRHSEPGLSMISAVTSKGQLRWTTFHAPLDATTLVGFLRRLISGVSKKVFLIMDDCHVADEGTLDTWLLEHDDAIEAVHGPQHRLAA